LFGRHVFGQLDNGSYQKQKGDAVKVDDKNRA
jgi:hypothetical protein